ncbi:MAG: L-fucose mutarotase [Treponema sp.]|jgi:L-fucose mutarotase|nr:L-fucose mutarotase [Treponema sp.]
MLKRISSIISPELLKILCEMGHGDELVIGDGNFPASSIAAEGSATLARLVRADGHGVPELLEAVMVLFPLDTYASPNAILMEVAKGDTVVPVIWDKYKKILAGEEGDRAKVGYIERFAFYERAKKAYAVLATGESSLYANIILRKGVVK